MNILSLLKKNLNVLGMSAEDALTFLNTKNISYEDHNLYTFRELTNRYGAEFSAIALGGLKAASASNPLLDAAYISICTTGIDFANPITQGMIGQLQLAGVWNEDTANKLKSIGITNISLVEQEYGVGSTASNEDLGIATAQYNEQVAEENRQNFRNKIASQYNLVFSALTSDNLVNARELWAQGLTFFE